MPQPIQQDVNINIKTHGAENAKKDLDDIDFKIKQVTRVVIKTSGVNHVMSDLSKIEKKLNKILSITRKINKEMGKVKIPTQQKQNYTKKSSGPLGFYDAPERWQGTYEIPKAPIPVMPKALPPVMPIEADFEAETKTSKVEKLKNSIHGLNQKMKELSSTAKYAKDSMLAFGNSLGIASAKSKDAMFNFFRLRAIIATIASGVFISGGLLKGWFDLASDYAEANHLFYTTLASSMRDVDDAERTVALHGEDVFGNITRDAINVTPALYDAANAVNTFARSMALDPTSVKRTYANFYELAVSADVSSDKIAQLSHGMTQLTYDLASLNDLPFEEVQKRLHSGLSGVTSAVRSLGPDISRTAADAWLLNNGFNATYNELTRNNKMLVIYNLLVENTRTAQGDLARSALQPANMMRILGEQTRVAARMLGSAIFPVVSKLIPLFIMLARAVQYAAAKLASFFGRHFSWYKKASDNWNSYMSGIKDANFGGVGLGGLSDDLDDATSGLGDVAGGANKAGGAAKKAKKALKELRDFQLGFDELHVLPDEPEPQDDNVGGVGKPGGGGGGLGGLGGGGGLDIPLEDIYDYGDSVWDAIEGEARDTLNDIKDWIDRTFGTGTAEAFGRTVQGIFQQIQKSSKELYWSARVMFHDLSKYWNWVDFLDGVTIGFRAMSDAITEALSLFMTTFPNFIDFLCNLPIVGGFFRLIFENTDKLTGVLVGAGLALGPFKLAFKGLIFILKPVINLIKNLIKFLTPIGKLVGKAAIGFFKFGKNLVGFIKPFTQVSGGLKGLVTIVGGAAKKFGIVGVIIGQILNLIQVSFEHVPEIFKNIKEILTSDDPIQAFFDYIKERWESGEFLSLILDILGLDFLIPKWEELWGKLQNSSCLSDLKETVTEKIEELKEKLKEKFGNIGEAWDEAWTSIKENPVIQAVAEGIENFKENVKEKWNTLMDNLHTWWNDTWEAIKENPFVQLIDAVISGKKDAISEAWSNLTESLYTWWNDTWEKITSNPFFGLLVGLVTGNKDLIEESWNTLVEDLNNWWDSTWDDITNNENFVNIVEKAKGIAEKIKNKWDDLTDKLNTKWGDTWSKISTNPLFVGLKGLVTGDVSEVKKAWTNGTETLKSKWSNAWDIIRNNPIVNSICDFISGIKNSMSGTWTDLTSALSSDWDNSWNDISANRFISFTVETIVNFANRVRDAWHGVCDAIASVKSSLSSGFPRPNFKLPHFSWYKQTVGSFTFPVFGGIHWYKKGGIFDQASTIGVGESGPEAVVPLTSNRMKPFADAIASNLELNMSRQTNVDFDEAEIAQTIGSAVYNAMIKGFPRDIKTDVYLDATKVNDELTKNKNLRGTATSLIS